MTHDLEHLFMGIFASGKYLLVKHLFRSLTYFFNLVVCFMLMSFKSSLYYLDKNHSSIRSFANIFSKSVVFSSVRHSVMSNSLQPHGLQHTRLPSPSLTPGACSSSCPSSWWCHPTISSSVIPFSSCLQSFPASGSFLVSQFFASDGQSIGVSALASFLSVNIQDLFPLGWTGFISLSVM